MSGLFFWKRGKGGSGRDKKGGKAGRDSLKKGREPAACADDEEQTGFSAWNEDDGGPTGFNEYEDDEDEVTGFNDDGEQAGFSAWNDDEETGFNDEVRRPVFSSRHESGSSGFSSWHEEKARRKFSAWDDNDDDDDGGPTGFNEYEDDDGGPTGFNEYENDDDEVTGFNDEEGRPVFSARHEDRGSGFSPRREEKSGREFSAWDDNDEDDGGPTGFNEYEDEDGGPTGFNEYEDDDGGPTGFNEYEDDDEVTGFNGDDRTGFSSRYDDDGGPTGFNEYEDDGGPTGFDGAAGAQFSESDEESRGPAYSSRLGYVPGMSTDGDEEGTGLRESSHRLMNRSKRQWMPLIVRTMTGENIFVSETPFYIGRSRYRVHFRVDNPQISNMHAVIMKKDDAYYIKDTGSLNGTYINGERLDVDDARALYNGMVFELAGETFTVVFRKVEV